jgi:hypothetical protein
MNAIANERTKFLASVLQTTATSCFTVGTATPLAGYLYDIRNLRSTLDNWPLPSGSRVGFRLPPHCISLQGTF